MKAVVAAFNQEKVLVGAFSVITNLRMELFEALLHTPPALILTAAAPHPDLDQIWIGHVTMMMMAGSPPGVTCGDHWL